MTNMKYVVIIPAAGLGKRMGMGKNKLFLEVFEQPIIIHTLKVFENDHLCKGIILVVNENDQQEMKQLLQQYKITKIHSIVTGGKERQDSVYEGLKAVSDESIILIHDGARPFVKKDHIHKLLEATAKHGAAVLGVPVKDTVKLAENEWISETLERSKLWMIQTPQAFERDLIIHAHEQARNDGFLGTDDASLLERLGKKVVIVEGDYDNIKITTIEDLYFAKAIVEKNSLKITK